MLSNKSILRIPILSIPTDKQKTNGKLENINKHCFTCMRVLIYSKKCQ